MLAIYGLIVLAGILLAIKIMDRYRTWKRERGMVVKKWKL